MTRLKATLSGIVQGVGFRPFVYRVAIRNNLSGYVRNRGDSCLEILVEGQEDDIKNFLRELVEKKPPLSRIYEIVTTPLQGEREHKGFTIYKSSEKTEFSGSIIPPDISICDECLGELRDSQNPRYDFFFITCTNCGPRFTIIEDVPYDRENTTMREFPMCDFCKHEYENPANRRFHAQTVACPKCGPKVYLLANNGELIENKDPIREAGRLLSEGNIVAVKGYGGFHVATSTLLDEPLERLRKTKHRKQKPFAIMARSLEVIRTFAEMSVEEAKILTSYMRPIVLLNKNEKYYLSDLVAPELHNVGVMLPYTGLHYMLFDKVSDPAYVMTSANPPNQPIVKDDDEAFEKLGEVVDYFLIHNRRIAHRCDDSVIRLHGEKTVFIRRSRGYSPEPVILKSGIKNCTLGLGGEENNTACVILGNKAFLSQHIGDVENIATLEFLESSSKRLIRLTNSKVEAIACDLHPKFITTMLARKLAEENDWQMFQVQHHHAHLAALMAEHAVDEMVGICCDGYGYGLNGEAWGGEILLYRKDSLGFERLGHLQEQPLIGADLATRYPLRVAAGILNRQMDVENWLMANVNNLPYGEREAEIILSQLKRGMNIVKTTSCGRILDAISAILGICYERTYEGEPSMKLESAALRGQNSLKIEPVINGNLLDTTRLVREIFERKEKSTKFDLALSAHIYLAEGLASLAIEKAIENNVKTIGFTGGVACNQIISSKIRETVESAGLKFLVHETVPPGDGGISLGQSFLAGLHQD